MCLALFKILFVALRTLDSCTGIQYKLKQKKNINKSKEKLRSIPVQLFSSSLDVSTVKKKKKKMFI